MIDPEALGNVGISTPYIPREVDTYLDSCYVLLASYKLMPRNTFFNSCLAYATCSGQ